MNIGFFSVLSMNGLQIIFFIVFFSKRLKPIKNYMLVYEPFDPNVDPPNPPKSKKTFLSFSNKENDKNNNIHINDILDRNNNSSKNLSKKEKEIQKSILINNLLRKTSKKEAFKDYKNNNEDNDDVLIVHYISSEDSKSVSSHYKKMDINKKSKLNLSGSDSNSERYKKKSTKSINKNMRRKRIIHLDRDEEDDNEISGNKTSSFEEKTGVVYLEELLLQRK